ncbi:unnamed protein product [Diabrotica balteata]|uniref:Uncharacterized protein n=1 Tax=Diabrotica balteata TaxID=107213 RepID=A0A9N9SVB9_DIABA|nr:unnamed protein product [Diabrotica balteata]
MAESEGNGIPSLTLPSISEDDENAHEEGETSPLSPNRSPVHALSNSPRHAKFNLRRLSIAGENKEPLPHHKLSDICDQDAVIKSASVAEEKHSKQSSVVSANIYLSDSDDSIKDKDYQPDSDTDSDESGKFQDSVRRPRMGGVATNHLAMLRQRVERQRSVILPHHSKPNSMEEINSELKSDVENTRNGVDRLDDQISTLHQDVATLSMEVRNAIQALQEMATPSSCSASVINYSAQSNPNIAHLHHSPSGNGILARSNSHPPEMFCWEGPPSPPFAPIRTYIDSQTQTESTVTLMRQYILENPKRVLEMMGLDPEKIMNSVEIKKSRSIPDYTNRLRNFSDFSGISENLNSPPDTCLVEVETDVVRGENCSFSWNKGGRKVQIFETLNSNKTQNALLKFRNNVE